MFAIALHLSQAVLGMIGTASKIGEFFASLMWALFDTAAKVVMIAVLSLALLLAVLFAVQYVLSRRGR
jgi:hypothetical protein